MSIYTLDWEFLDDGKTIMPISFGMVEHGGAKLARNRDLYFEMQHDEVRVQADPWLRENVVPHLIDTHTHRLDALEAIKAIEDFLGDDRDPVFWGYYADYDWVCLCQLWGPMVTLPKHFPKLCLDLQQWWIQLGRPEGVKPPDSIDAHDALADARWNMELYEALDEYARSQRDS